MGRANDEPMRRGPTIRRLMAVLAGAIAAFMAASMAIVWVATEPESAAAAAAKATMAPARIPEPTAVAPAVPPPLPPGTGIAMPPELSAHYPIVSMPTVNVVPPIAGLPADGLPAEAGELDDQVLGVPRDRFADQIQRMSRRNLDRGGVANDAGAPPPKPGSSWRRGPSLEAEE